MAEGTNNHTQYYALGAGILALLADVPLLGWLRDAKASGDSTLYWLLFGVLLVGTVVGVALLIFGVVRLAKREGSPK